VEWRCFFFQPYIALFKPNPLQESRSLTVQKRKNLQFGVAYFHVFVCGRYTRYTQARHQIWRPLEFDFHKNLTRLQNHFFLSEFETEG